MVWKQVPCNGISGMTWLCQRHGTVCHSLFMFASEAPPLFTTHTVLCNHWTPLNLDRYGVLRPFDLPPLPPPLFPPVSGASPPSIQLTLIHRRFMVMMFHAPAAIYPSSSLTLLPCPFPFSLLPPCRSSPPCHPSPPFPLSSFSTLYDTEHFIQSLKDDVRIVKELPPEVAESRRELIVRVRGGERKGGRETVIQ